MKDNDMEETYKVFHNKERIHRPYALFGYFNGATSLTNSFWPEEVVLSRCKENGTFTVCAKNEKKKGLIEDVVITLNINEWHAIAKKILRMTEEAQERP